MLAEHFFAAVRSRQARLDRYLRNGESPNRILVLCDAETASWVLPPLKTVKVTLTRDIRNWD
jgi:hypothetical protein